MPTLPADAPLDGAGVIKDIRARTDTILLAFSCGKDSIATWIECRKHFPHIYPYYMYLVPDLQFVNRSLDYYEQFFGCHIARYPHPSLYQWLRRGVFQAPERLKIIEQFGLLTPDYGDLQDVMRAHLKLGPDSFVASGVRAADSPVRLLAIKKHGAISENKRQFFPIWDWNKARLLDCIRGAGVKLPADYRVFGRSFDGLDYRFLAPMKEAFPRDYQRILEWFPLAETELKRRQYYAEQNEV
jgi:hypothetical protein